MTHETTSTRSAPLRRGALAFGLLTLLVSVTCLGAESSGLFNGRDLESWQCKPAALSGHWKVEDRMIVGENPDKKGSVLWTKEDYGDYELELEYMTPSPDYDSGVFVRGASHQVQIGVSRSLKVDLTACIYAPKDGAGRYPARSDKVKAVHKLGKWNALRMVVRGKRTETFLNGESFVDYEGKTLPERGPIGLQLHGGVHMKMLFRNIKLKRLDGWRTLFDGESLAGWDGDPRFWSLRDGAITGETTAANPTRGNTFIIFVGENRDKTPVEFGDFELELEFRIVGHNSGIQYRSFKLPGAADRWRIGGYQADVDAAKSWAGTNYGEKFRGVLAKRGERATLTGTKTRETKRGPREIVVREVERIGDPVALAGKIKDAPEWNVMRIVARGNHLVQKINGVTMSEVIDNDEKNRRSSGLIAVQLHGGPPMTVQVRKVRIKTDGK